MNTQCDEDDGPVEFFCDQIVVVDNGFYESAETDTYTPVNAIMDGGCLTVLISASGCDGSTWSMVLVDSGAVAESSPEQRFLKLAFTNNEACLAVFSQERTFDVRPLQVEGSNEIILNIEGFPEPVTYSYSN
ncbi:hypothetical protein [Psychroserpens sp. SPM9]|uniref:hypothetical protein n=1 Tax=Psychroserpens sp. SPM9 TaxID=2975598 RepID=UPI0021A84584|nr:hypothetical protein [Psychroserpens sp. SPM9]MDG5492759.1 hypothetical protein [Psychroserpens sp. SPM9]